MLGGSFESPRRRRAWRPLLVGHGAPRGGRQGSQDNGALAPPTRLQIRQSTIKQRRIDWRRGLPHSASRQKKSRKFETATGKELLRLTTQMVVDQGLRGHREESADLPGSGLHRFWRNTDAEKFVDQYGSFAGYTEGAQVSTTPRRTTRIRGAESANTLARSIQLPLPSKPRRARAMRRT